jgi:hypothetical protein
VLEIAEGSEPAADAPVRPFFAITLDGVVAGVPVENEPDETLGVRLTRLLLMPGSRAEIFVRAGSCAGDATLRTVGIQTGPGGNPAPTGDPWPRIALARVHTVGQACKQAREFSAPAVAPFGLDIKIPRRSPQLSGAASGASAEEMLRATIAPPATGTPNTLSAVEPDLASLHPGCRFLPAPNGGTSYRRRIIFAQETVGQNTIFELGSEVVDQSGNPISGKIAPRNSLIRSTGALLRMYARFLVPRKYGSLSTPLMKCTIFIFTRVSSG